MDPASLPSVEELVRRARGGYVLVGGDGSPYSQKLRAVLRYRHIAHEWVPMFSLGGQSMFGTHFAELRGAVIPVLVRPDGSYGNDSTPLIAELERAVPHRPVVPRDPALAFVANLLEEYVA
jgi:glutathione S-transferase